LRKRPGISDNYPVSELGMYESHNFQMAEEEQIYMLYDFFATEVLRSTKHKMLIEAVL
jgi:hypothetical protein